MQITVNLNLKWDGGNNIITPIDPITPIQPIEPPIDSDIIDITELWYNTFSKGYGDIILESGKVYTLNTIKTQRIIGKVNILTTGEEPAFLWVGKEMYIIYVDKGEDSVLFMLDNGAEIIIKNINVSMRPQSNNVQDRYAINWFTSVQNENAKWVALVKDCDTTLLGRNGGLGTGIVYGGLGENYLGFINYKHAGPMIMELKNPWVSGVLYGVFQNITTDYKNPDEWMAASHETTGIISKSNHILNLTGDVEASCLYNHFFITDKGANRSFIAHIGRFTFMVDLIDSVIDLKNIQLRPFPKAGEKVFVRGNRFFFSNREPHPNDSFTINNSTFLIKEKLKTEWDEWTNEWGNGLYPQLYKSPQCIVDGIVNLPDGEYELQSYDSSFDLSDINSPIYLIYKADMNFRTKPNTQFGDPQIVMSRPSHIAYNHSKISLWVDNVHLDGYYRQSTNGLGDTLGYNMINYSGFDDEFNPPVPITDDKPMPNRISNLL